MKNKDNLFVRVMVLVALGLTPQAEAEFALNFQPIGSGVMSTTSVRGGGSFGGQTPFLVDGSLNMPEIVSDPTTGLNYYHMIVGSPAEGFVQESFIQVSVIPGTILTCSGNTCATNLNNMDPLGGSGLYYTGNAAANPRGTIIRQILSDGEITIEFLKDKYNRKPLITQTIMTPDIVSTFKIDMRNSTYDDKNTPGVVSNTFSFTDPGTNPSLGSFDMARDGQKTNITAGRYTYTNGTGNGGSQGTYNYVEGGAVFDADWTIYMDKLDSRNIWSYPQYQPQ